MNYNKKLLKSKKGQGLIEYLILVAILAVGTMGAVTIVGTNLNKNYAKVNKALGAKDQEDITMSKVGNNQLSDKDLSNFMSGAKQ